MPATARLAQSWIDQLTEELWNVVALILLLGIVATLLAATGIYGAVSFAVNQRTKELGIRVALGAGRLDIIREVFVSGGKPVIRGLLAGLWLSVAVAAALGQSVKGSPVRLETANPLLYFGAALLLAVAAVLLTLAGLFDFFDGSLARLANRVSAFGAFLDSAVDRYSDLVVLLGVVLFYHLAADTAGVLLTMLTVLGTVMVSYTKARAQSIGLSCEIGLMERPERLITLIAGATFNLLTPAMVVLAVLTNLTALQRILVETRLYHRLAAAGGVERLVTDEEVAVIVSGASASEASASATSCWASRRSPDSRLAVSSTSVTRFSSRARSAAMRSTSSASRAGSGRRMRMVSSESCRLAIGLLNSWLTAAMKFCCRRESSASSRSVRQTTAMQATSTTRKNVPSQP